MIRYLPPYAIFPVLLMVCVAWPTANAAFVPEENGLQYHQTRQSAGSMQNLADILGKGQTSAPTNIYLALSLPYDKPQPESLEQPASGEAPQHSTDGGAEEGLEQAGKKGKPERSGQPAPEDFPRRSTDGNAEGRAQQTGKDDIDLSTQGEGALTDNEEIIIMDRQLEEKLTEFDKIILREQAQIADRENEQGGSLGGTPVEGAAGSVSPIDNDESASSAVRRQPGSPGDNREREFDLEAPPPLPNDIPDGKDDDVVARQLREAAMREKDPVLREKLWDEYRKYKQGL